MYSAPIGVFVQFPKSLLNLKRKFHVRLYVTGLMTEALMISGPELGEGLMMKFIEIAGNLRKESLIMRRDPAAHSTSGGKMHQVESARGRSRGKGGEKKSSAQTFVSVLPY